MVQAGLAKKQDPISKITYQKKTIGMARAVEFLPCKSEALSSNPSTANKQTKNPKL
jgi:hypothetical protein